MSLEMSANPLGLVNFNRARVGLLLGHADEWKYVKNRPTLYFQFSGQIVDSNLLLHPPLVSSELPLSAHINPSRFRCAFVNYVILGSQALLRP